MEITDNQKQLRKIVHIGVDCFYVAVEMRDDPSLKGHPVVVGDAPTQQGVIFSANLKAREVGIHAGMESSRAKQLYPTLLIILPEMKKYEKESKKMRAIFHRFADLVEPLSPNETYLDITDSDHFKGDALLIASEIQKLIHEELSLTTSAGIASNKFLAKAASDLKKPDGLSAITPGMVDDFVRKLPAKIIWEAGKEAVDKMAILGLKTCGDLQNLSLNELNSNFESKGEQIYNLCRGIDSSSVVHSKGVKSFTLEETISSDIQLYDEDKKDEKPEKVEEPSLKTLAKIKEDEEVQKKEQIYKPILEILKNAKATFIEIEEKKYSATLTDCKLGEQITFTISKPDTYLSMSVSDGDQVVLRLITAKSSIIAFKSKLIKKKLPKLILTFPSKESIKSIRNTERVTAKMSAKIIIKESENKSILGDISAMGSIGNVSDTGCSFTTKVKLEKHNKIYLAIVVPIKGAQKVFQIHGTIQRVNIIDDELTNYGIECFDVDKRILEGIRKFMQSQSDQ